MAVVAPALSCIAEVGRTTSRAWSHEFKLTASYVTRGLVIVRNEPSNVHVQRHITFYHWYTNIRAWPLAFPPGPAFCVHSFVDLVDLRATILSYSQRDKITLYGPQHIEHQDYRFTKPYPFVTIGETKWGPSKL